MAPFTYARFSEAALEHVKATSVLAFTDDAPATPDHLRRALEWTPDPELCEQWEAARAPTRSQFTPELTAVLQRAAEATEASVEPADLVAALKQTPKQSDDPEAWARDHVRVDVAQFTETHATWTAHLEADGEVFEHSQRGDLTQRKVIRQRLIDAVIAQFIDRDGQSH